MAIKLQSIIVAVDDLRVGDRISTILDSSYVVLATSDIPRATGWLRNDLSVSAIVVAQNLKGGKALKLLEEAQQQRPEARRILIANYSELSQFVEGLHSGAVQRTISTPIDASELLGLVRVPLAPVNFAGSTSGVAR